MHWRVMIQADDKRPMLHAGKVFDKGSENHGKVGELCKVAISA